MTAKKAKTPKYEYPEFLYVTHEKDDDEEWFTAASDAAYHANTEAPTSVAVYVFSHTETVKLEAVCEIEEE